MKRFVQFISLVTTTFSLVAVSHADAPKCHKDAAKLEWFMCVVKPVEYKQGLKKVSRDECVVNEKIELAGGCDLGDLTARVPDGVDSSNVYFYAIGPKDFDLEKGFAVQREQDKFACGLNIGRPFSWQLGKFSDAPGAANDERSREVDAQLAGKGKKVVGGVMVARFPGTECGGKKALHAALAKPGLDTALWYAETTFAK